MELLKSVLVLWKQFEAFLNELIRLFLPIRLIHKSCNKLYIALQIVADRYSKNRKKSNYLLQSLQPVTSVNKA